MWKVVTSPTQMRTCTSFWSHPRTYKFKAHTTPCHTTPCIGGRFCLEPPFGDWVPRKFSPRHPRKRARRC